MGMMGSARQERNLEWLSARRAVGAVGGGDADGAPRRAAMRIMVGGGLRGERSRW